MLDLIVLYFLTKEIGKLAYSKGLKPITWKVYTIIGWLLFEIIGLFAGVIIFGGNNIPSIILLAIAFAVTSYFIIKGYLNKLPDYFDDDINNIGNN
jgi:4-hydroxybenzoate polyprenyltransferase